MTCVVLPSGAAAGATTVAAPAPVDRGGRTQRPGERGPVGEALLGRLGHPTAYDGREVGGHRVGQVGHRVAQVGDRGGDRGVGDERLASGQALEGHDGEGVDVGRRGGGGALGLLGRDVGGRAHHLAGLRQRHPLGRARDAEVGHLDPAVGGDEQVGGLHVAVHDPGGVGDAEGVGRLGEQLLGGGRVERCPRSQQGGERLAVDELHDQVGAVGRRPVVGCALPVVEDRGDAGVVQRGGVARLGLEAGAEERVVGVLGLEHLDRHGPVQDGVARRPHLAHAAGGDARLEEVAVGVVDVAARGQRRHWLITASMTALAIGPPRRPPPISEREVSLDCTSTATATWGLSAGAKETNHA